jgi:hypothetical protein
MIMLGIVTVGIGLTVFGYWCETAPEWDDETQAPAAVAATAPERA